MLMSTGPGTFDASPLDVIMVVQDASTKRYHIMFLEEHPLPGPVQPMDKTSLVRLKSKMHHTKGAATLDEAQAQLVQMRRTINLRDGSVLREIMAMDAIAPLVLMARNWLSAERITPDHLNGPLIPTGEVIAVELASEPGDTSGAPAV